MESKTFYDRALKLLNSHGLDFNWMSSKWTQNITIMAMKEFSDEENKDLIKKSEYEINLCRREYEEVLKNKDKTISELSGFLTERIKRDDDRQKQLKDQSNLIEQLCSDLKEAIIIGEDEGYDVSEFKKTIALCKI